MPGRFEMRHGLDSGPLLDLRREVEASAAFATAVAALGGEAEIVGCSCVVADEDCAAQSWHVDGGHVDASKHAPCHCINIFVPLVDVRRGGGDPRRAASTPGNPPTPREGADAVVVSKRKSSRRGAPAGTEFKPGSHFLTRDLARQMLLARVRKTLRPPVVPTLSPGDAVLFDYRVLHRGTKNTSGGPRPVFVLTVAKPWFRDLVNFPRRALFDGGAFDANAG